MAADGVAESRDVGSETRATERSLSTAQRGEAYYYLIKAQLAARRGRFLEVLRELREAVSRAPESAALHAEAASLLLKLGQRTEASQMAKRALELEADHPLAIRVLADLAAARATGSGGNSDYLQEAIALYEKLAARSDVEDEVLLVLAQLKFRTNNAAGAVPIARRLVGRRPGDPGAARLLAQSLMLDGRPGEAMDAVLEFLEANPGHEEFLLLAEELARQTERWEDLAEACARITEAEPGRAEPRRVRGEALVYLDRLPEAMVELERAYEADPGNPTTRQLLASVYGSVGRLADAAGLARELLVEYPDALEARRMLGEALDRQGDVDGALEAFTSVLRRMGGSREVSGEQRDRLRFRIAALYLENGRPREAVEILEKTESPDRPDALVLRARAALARRELRSARVIARRLRSGGAPGQGALVEGEAALLEGDLSVAMERFREAIALDGRPARFRAVDVLQDRGTMREAEELLLAWIREEPANADARLALGSFLERDGRFADAEVELRRALELNPVSAIAMNYLGYSLADRNERLEEAMSLIQRALEIDPWNGAYLDSLGWVYFRMGRYEDARAPLERAAREYPRDATVLDHLGDLYKRLGRHEAAVRAWRRALEAGPSDPDSVRRKLREARSD
jgi:tetratricopeptide (TPR) repeat protein